jgi:hypothetical protein
VTGREARERAEDAVALAALLIYYVIVCTWDDATFALRRHRNYAPW